MSEIGSPRILRKGDRGPLNPLPRLPEGPEDWGGSPLPPSSPLPPLKDRSCVGVERGDPEASRRRRLKGFGDHRL